MRKVGKRIKLAPGIRLNLNKKSVGASIGGVKFRYTYNSRTGSKWSGQFLGKNWSIHWPGLRLGGNESQASRKQRELNKRALEIGKLEEKEQARLEVDMYELEVERLTSFHRESHPEVQWSNLADSDPPFERDEPGPLEREAQLALDSYKPGFWRRWFRGKDQALQQLRDGLAKARQEDENNYNSWLQGKRIAQGVMAGQLPIFKEVILHALEPKELTGSTGHMEFFLKSHEVIEVVWESLSERVIPTETKTLTKTGKVSVKSMSKTQFYSLYQDYVCSAVLRMALDLFAILPLAVVYVHVYEERVATATGHRFQAPVLSVQFDRTTLLSLNKDELDPSDALSQFAHRMSFQRTSGFQPIDILTASSEASGTSAG